MYASFLLELLLIIYQNTPQLSVVSFSYLNNGDISGRKKEQLIGVF